MLHMIKLCVGAQRFSDIENWQKRLARELVSEGKPAHPYHDTRMWPRRKAELLDGGSIYWVVANRIIARQKIIALNEVYKGETRYCRLVFDARLFVTEPQPRRAFQGWRYLKPEDAPKDLGQKSKEALPTELQEALLEAGVW